MSGLLLHYEVDDDATARDINIIGHEEYVVIIEAGDEMPEPESGFHLARQLDLYGEVHLLPTREVLIKT